MPTVPAPLPTVIVERAPEGYAVLTLNRPQARNALSHALRTELATALRTLAGDPGARVLIITGAGDAFCAGLDLKELGRAGLPGGPAQPADDRPEPLDRLVSGFPGPVIGAINGAAITGGFELALACDVLIASERARFADTHARVGVMPGWGLSQRLSRAIGIYRAKELSLSGNFLSAQQADAWGLVNRVVAHDALLPAARALARDMLGAIPEMLVAYKRVIDDGFAQPFGDAMRTERERAMQANAAVDAAALEARRSAVVERGRQQALDKRD